MAQEHQNSELVTWRVVEKACQERAIIYEMHIKCPDMLGSESGLCQRVFKMKTLNYEAFLKAARASGWIHVESLQTWICPNCRDLYILKLRKEIAQ